MDQLPAPPPVPPEQAPADRALSAVLGVLLQRGASGQPMLSEDQLRTTLALLFIDLIGHMQPSPQVVGASASVAQVLGVRAKDSPEVARQKIAKRAAALPPMVRVQLEQALRELIAAGGLLNAAARVVNVIGGATVTGPLDSGLRPANTIPAGPMARVAAQLKSKKAKNK